MVVCSGKMRKSLCDQMMLGDLNLQGFVVLLNSTFVCYSGKQNIKSLEFQSKQSELKVFSSKCLLEVEKKANHQESTKNVSETIVSPVSIECIDPSELHVMAAGPSKSKSPSIEIGVPESLRRSSKKKYRPKLRVCC